MFFYDLKPRKTAFFSLVSNFQSLMRREQYSAVLLLIVATEIYECMQSDFSPYYFIQV